MKERNKQRYEHTVTEELSKLILRELDIDPGVLLTITRVKVSSDFDHASVYVSVLPEKVQGSVLASLRARHKEFAFLLGDVLEKGHTPRLVFELDTDTLESYRIDRLLDQIENEHESSNTPSS